MPTKQQLEDQVKAQQKNINKLESLKKRTASALEEAWEAGHFNLDNLCSEGREDLEFLVEAYELDLTTDKTLIIDIDAPIELEGIEVDAQSLELFFIQEDGKKTQVNVNHFRYINDMNKITVYVIEDKEDGQAEDNDYVAV